MAKRRAKKTAKRGAAAEPEEKRKKRAAPKAKAEPKKKAASKRKPVAKKTRKPTPKRKPAPRPKLAPRRKPTRTRTSETAWQRRLKSGTARGLTETQAAGKPSLDEVRAGVLRARPDELVRRGRPTPLLADEVRRLTRASGRRGMAALRAFLLGLLGRGRDHSFHGFNQDNPCDKCGDAYDAHQPNALGDLYDMLGLGRRKGFNLFFSEFYPEVTWDY